MLAALRLFLIDLIGEPIKCTSRWHFSLSHVTYHLLRVFAIRREDLYYWFAKFDLFCSVFICFFVSPLCLIMEKMSERSYFDVVSGCGKFSFQYLPGICLVFAAILICASDFTWWPRTIVCFSESSDSESELLCKKLGFLGKMMPVYTLQWNGFELYVVQHL